MGICPDEALVTGTGILGMADLVIGYAGNTANSDAALPDTGFEALRSVGALAYAENDANVVVAGVVASPGGVDGPDGITVPSNPGIGSVVGTA